MKKKNPNYKFIVLGNTVICISRYAGKTVKGIAKCSPEDNFDLEFGKKLAQLRCDLKVAQKRFNKYEQCAQDYLYMASKFTRESMKFSDKQEIVYNEIMDLKIKINEMTF